MLDAINLWVVWWKGTPETDERWEDGDGSGVVRDADTGDPIVFTTPQDAEEDILDTTAPEERDEYEVRRATLIVDDAAFVRSPAAEQEVVK